MSFYCKGTVMLIRFSSEWKGMELLQINNRQYSGDHMPDKTMYEGLKQENRGLKDPGNMLIAVYIFFILFLILFANMASASVNGIRAVEGTFSAECMSDSPCLSPVLFDEGSSKN